MSDAPDSNLDPRAASDSAGASSLPMFDFYVEQLETYLDGELDADEAAAVRQRLADEPAYAAALDRLHRQRQLRLDVLGQANQAADDEMAAARLRACATRLSTGGQVVMSPIETVRASMADTKAPSTRSPSRSPALTRWWIGSAVAACMVVAFGLGMYGRLERGTPPAPVVSNPVPPLEGNMMLITDKDGNVMVQKELTDTPPPTGREPASAVVPAQNP